MSDEFRKVMVIGEDNITRERVKQLINKLKKTSNTMSVIKTVEELKTGDVFLAPHPNIDGETIELTVKGFDGSHVLIEEMGGVDVLMDEYEVVRSKESNQRGKEVQS